MHSIEEAKKQGVSQATEKLKDKIEGKEILNREVKVSLDADYMEIEVIYEVKENIGIKEKIVF